MLRTRVLAAGLAALVVAGTAASAASVSEPARVGSTAWRVDPPPPADADPELRAAAHLVEAVNAYRVEHGRSAVAWNPAVASAAQRHASYLAELGRLAHTGPNGADAGDRLVAAGFAWAAWGETLGAGSSHPQPLVDAWAASADHRRHLVGDFTYAGAGVTVTADGVPYWVLVLAS